MNSEDLSTFKTLYIYACRTQFVTITAVEFCVVKVVVCCTLWPHLRVRCVGSIENTVVSSGFYPTDSRITPFEVREYRFIYMDDG